VSHRCLDVQRSARPRCVFGRLFGFDPLHPDAVSWYRGALGERRVGRILADLGREWRVLHAVPHGDADADIDHLVIGPPGVFTITTSGPVAADLEARAASRALSRAIGSPIVAAPIVVVTTKHGQPGGPAVVPVPRLVRHLRDLPAVFDPAAAASVARAAEEWTTWRPFALGSGYTDPDDAFGRLHAEVTRARTRRILWQLAGVSALVAMMFAIAAGIFR
jgi:hypothetical protein